LILYISTKIVNSGGSISKRVVSSKDKKNDVEMVKENEWANISWKSRLVEEGTIGKKPKTEQNRERTRVTELDRASGNSK